MKQLNDFFNRHDLFMDRAWIEKHGSKYAKELLSDYCVNLIMVTQLTIILFQQE